MPRLRTRLPLLILASTLSVLPSTGQSLPDWAAPSQAASDPGTPGIPSTPGGPGSTPGFPSTPGGPGNTPGFPNTPGGPGFVPNFPTSPAEVPLDGGLVWLALAGGAYAAKRLRTQRDDASI